MTETEGLLTKDNKEGIERVYKGEEDYGFLMESSSILYETERRCNLTDVGERLDDKNYGIGMRKSIDFFLDAIVLPFIVFFCFKSTDFQYHSQMSEGVLLLQEKGKLAILQTKWWKERKGGGACSVSIFVSFVAIG